MAVCFARCRSLKWLPFTTRYCVFPTYGKWRCLVNVWTGYSFEGTERRKHVGAEILWVFVGNLEIWGKGLRCLHFETLGFGDDPRYRKSQGVRRVKLGCKKTNPCRYFWRWVWRSSIKRLRWIKTCQKRRRLD